MKTMYQIKFHLNEIKEIEVESETESFVKIVGDRGRTAKNGIYGKIVNTFDQAVLELDSYHEKEIEHAQAMYNVANQRYEQFKAKYK